KVAEYCGTQIPTNYPVVGSDAFRTGTGVHAAAIIKSMAKEEDFWLRDLIYSGVAAKDFGFKQVIEIGPMSGKSNIEFWLHERGLKADDALVDKIFEAAKKSNKILSENEIYKIIVETSIAYSDKIAV
ncbi:MAG: hypothetical protein HQK54_16815, partial [Oligoflexales bacterium]|nr:hypothetical protein [Oligoflexales bacterium]